MTRTASTLLREALRLTEEDRLALAEGLLHSLQVPMAEEIRLAWVAEAERRAAQLTAGEVEALPAAAVFERMQRKYGE